MSEFFSKNSIDKAGKILRQIDASCEEYAECIRKINYWRRIHIEPMQRMMDIVYGCTNESTSAVSGRIKKLDTIIDKLGRLINPNVTTLYDIAGCRVVVPDMRQVELLSKNLNECELYDSKMSEKHDYLKRPHRSNSGYRGRHLIFKFEGVDSRHALRAELQVRTEMQHSWSTAVELYDKAAKTRLKFGSKENDENNAWTFFQRAAEVIRQIENNGNVDEKSIREKFPLQSSSEYALKISDILKEASQSSSILDYIEMPNFGYCIVDFLPYEQSIVLTPTTSNNALDDYYAHEQSYKNHECDTVLVRGRSVSQLSILYPNYFGDISPFLKLVDQYLPAFC